MRLVWTTDIHLNHVRMPAWDQWANAVLEQQGDAIVITGDISEAEDVAFQLQRMADVFPVPIHFVLGNHDFYGSSIGATRKRVDDCAREVKTLNYLTDSAPVELIPKHYLIGEDGWGDGTVGDYENSLVRLNDFIAIKDYTRIDAISWPKLMRHQGEESARRLSNKLRSLPFDAKEVIVATHVPPFREACWYEGKTADEQWAPFFVCGQVGKVLRQYALENPRVDITVLCGHTHHGGHVEVAPNLVVHTAPADYGAPKVERVIEVGV